MSPEKLLFKLGSCGSLLICSQFVQVFLVQAMPEGSGWPRKEPVPVNKPKAARATHPFLDLQPSFARGALTGILKYMSG